MNKFGLVLILVCGFSTSAWAVSPHKGISFQGVIKLPNGEYPSVAGVTVRGLILSPNNCILREEEFTSVNITNGYINLAIGQGAILGDDPGFTMAQVMDNSQTRSGLRCFDASGNRTSGSFNPSSGSGARKFRIDLVVNGTPVLADFNMRAMAFAVNSETLNGKTDQDFLQTDTLNGVTQLNLTKILSQTTKLENLLPRISADGASLTVGVSSALVAVKAQGLEAGYLVPLNQGGTGMAATSKQELANSLLPDQSGHQNHYLSTDGTNSVWKPVTAGTISEVAAGDGLVGGASAGTATLSLQDLGSQGTYTKVITDKHGRVTGGSNLGSVDIPALSAAKITSGVLSVDVQSSNVSATNLAGTNVKIWNGSKYLTFTYPTGGAGYDLEWPIAEGTPNSVLQTDGAGKLSWAPASSTPTGAANGDLSGSYPAPTVIQIQGRKVANMAPVSGQVMTWDDTNTTWKPDHVRFPTMTASKALISNASGVPTASAVSDTELGYLAGLTSAVQTQLNGKLSAIVSAPVDGQVLRYDSGSWVNSAIDAATDLTGVLAIANGGTGATTASAARVNLGLRGAAVLDTGSVAGAVPVLGFGGLVANKMCTSDGTASGVLCTSDIPTGSQWVSNGTAIFYSAGNVGIGTNSPSTKLAIQNEATAGLSFVNNNSGANQTANSEIGRMGFYPRHGGAISNEVAAISSVYTGDGTTRAGDLAFLTADSAAPVEAMRIKSYGWVGINTSNPGAELEVNGSLIASGAQISGGVRNTDGVVYGFNGPDLALKTNWTDTRLTIKSAGNVGIGTTTPMHRLDVVGDINVTGSFKVNGSNIATSGGTVTNVSSTSGDIAVTNGGTTPSLSLNSGVVGGASDANKIAKLDGSGRLPAAMLPTVTASKALISNASGVPTASAVSDTELGYLAGVTSAVQTQLNGKMSSALGNGKIYVGDASGAVQVAVSGDATLNNTGVLSLKNTGTVGTYYKVTTDAKGRVVSGSSALVASDIPALDISQITTGVLPVSKGGTNSSSALANNRLMASVGGAIVEATDLEYISGNIGIGRTPSTKLDVAGAVISRTNVIATGGSVNLNLGNNHLLKSVGGDAIILSNPVDGGAYTLVVADTASRTYSFSGCTNQYFNPANQATEEGTRSTYTILVVKDGANTDCYISWMTGFE